MARPIKDGLIYFSLDVDMADDDKVILIVAQHGIAGFGILIRLLMELYKNGYYYPWTEREQLIFSSRINAEINTVRGVVNDALKWGFFHQKLYEKYEILTSRGTQMRYLEGTAKRKEVTLIKEYLLIDPPKRGNIVFTGKNGVSAGKNPVNSGNNAQSKVHESKGNESKVLKPIVCSAQGETHETDKGESTPRPAFNEYPQDFEAFWQAYPKSRRKEKRAAYKAWKTRLKQGKAQGITPEALITAARHYAAEMAEKGKEAEYIKLPKTFLGPARPFEEYIDPPQEQDPAPPRAWAMLSRYINPEEVFEHDTS